MNTVKKCKICYDCKLCNNSSHNHRNVFMKQITLKNQSNFTVHLFLPAMKRSTI